jgi:hypothetical protein
MHYSADNINSDCLKWIFRDFAEAIADSGIDPDTSLSILAKLEEKYKDKFFGYWFGWGDVSTKIVESLGLDESKLEEYKDAIMSRIIREVDSGFDPEYGVAWTTIDAAIAEHADFIRELCE